MDRSLQWWKEDGYTKVRRVEEWRWLGRVWRRRPFYQTHAGFCAKGTDLPRLIRWLVQQGMMASLTEQSRVLEVGCNCGQNLLALQRAFRCEVDGIDISRRAIELARRQPWIAPAKFACDDVFTVPWRDLPEGWYDLALSRGHLMHLVPGPRKREYVRALQRISKVFLALEPPPPDGRASLRFYREGRYCLSLEDWAQDYQLSVYWPTHLPPLHPSAPVYWSRATARITEVPESGDSSEGRSGRSCEPSNTTSQTSST